jgi:hypothetical protein
MNRTPRRDRAPDPGFPSRRDLLKSTLPAGATLAAGLTPQQLPAAPFAPVLDIGSRWELFVDDFLVDRFVGKAELRLQHPVPREVVLVHDAPWEGSGSGYHSVFQDGDLYRMYYKAWQLTVAKGKLTQPHPLLACYAESKDGIRWTKPDLGLVAFNGSKKNNIVLVTGPLNGVSIDPGHVAVFKDDNPRAPAGARYKAFVRSPRPNGLVPLRSADGLRWSPMADGPVITRGAFDSQNLAFWDPVRGEYRAYFRYFTEGRRDILTATSPDFVHWTDPVPLEYPGAPKDHLYTNQIKPYPRAPHILIGFPTRYVDRGWSESMNALPELEHRQLRASIHPRYGTAITEGLFMTSRDGRTFKRWAEAFLRPGPEREHTWAYGNQYIAWHLVGTRPAIDGEPNELSLYASESYWTGTSSALRRYTLRLDGFVSAHAPYSGGEVVTRPLTFQGSKLVLNLSTSAAGGVQVEVQDPVGKPLPGFALADCPPVFGDAPERAVTWKAGANVSKLAGQAVRLRFALQDADVFAFRFA